MQDDKSIKIENKMETEGEIQTNEFSRSDFY